MTSLQEQRIQTANKVTLIGMLVDLVLGFLKILIGQIANSHALFADGIHSLSDAVTDVFVLIVTRISSYDPDSNHPYGHARFETLGSTLLGSILIAVALMLAYNYLTLLGMERSDQHPTWLALLIAVVSIIGKEWVYQFTRKAGEKLNSSLLIANAWHSRSDAFSSIVVLIGIIASMLGAVWVDIVAAIIVAIIIGKIGVQLVWENLKELVDTGLDQAELGRIRDTLLEVDGIINVHDVRSRRMGQSILLDMHLQVAPGISASEGHNIGEWAARALLSKFESINDVIYHIDTEDDHEANLSPRDNLLPLRAQVFEALQDCWIDYVEVLRVTLHYLENRVDVELYLEGDQDHSAAIKIEQRLVRRKARHPWLGDIRIWQEIKTQQE